MLTHGKAHGASQVRGIDVTSGGWLAGPALLRKAARELA
jgi:hypothetical protein